MSYKYVCSIITPRSGGAIFDAKLRVKIDFVDITTEQFRKDYDGSLYATGNTKDEAIIRAETILKKYQYYLQDLSELMKSQNSSQR